MLKFCILFLFITLPAMAHQSSATYVGNEAVLIINGDKKVLFDPFFHQTFGRYQSVPEDIKNAIFAGSPPYNDLTAIFISHAHGDHFSAPDMLNYLQEHPKVLLIAPQQALVEMEKLEGAKQVLPQTTGIRLEFNQAPIDIELAGLVIEAVRIPHSGWPGRAEIENLVFRVTLKDTNSPVTIMHMGDADANFDHYSPYKSYWQKRITDTGFPPYWFYLSAEGNDILSNMLNIKKSIGIHVPVEVPKKLKASAADFFSKPGETRVINSKHQH